MKYKLATILLTIAEKTLKLALRCYNENGATASSINDALDDIQFAWRVTPL